MLTEILYILIVLSFATLVAVIGKRHGVEYIIAVFAGLVLVANMVASKVVTFGNFVVPAAIIACLCCMFVATSFIAGNNK